MSDWEMQVSENSHTLIGCVESGDRARVAEFLGGLETVELQAVAVSVAQALLAQEAANDHLQERNTLLESGNVALYGERNALRERVTELRKILNAHAANHPRQAGEAA